MRTVAVIGKNFGDEGKGLACAGLSRDVKNTLIIKHNGGGQAGHTVECKDGKRFIHHQIGSGAEYGADTLLSATFMADLFQLGKELSEFRETFGFVPRIFAEKNTAVTVIDDVLRNMLIESARGDERHGSCGMGINECLYRHKAGFVLAVSDVQSLSVEELVDRLRIFRRGYGHKNVEALRAAFLESSGGAESEHYKMLMDDEVLVNFAAAIKETAGFVSVVDASSEWILGRYEQVVFETGQGLLLDQDYEEYAPFLTPSKTGLFNAARFLEDRGMVLDEVIYVTRPYVTRHGNGPLPCEVGACGGTRHVNGPLFCEGGACGLPGVGEDLTNVYNEWQGSIRYARHVNVDEFMRAADSDFAGVSHFSSMGKTIKALLITHLDETGDMVFFSDRDVQAPRLIDRLQKDGKVDVVLTSRSRYGIDEYADCLNEPE